MTTYKIDNVNFTVLIQDKPNQVVFLLGGDQTDSDWWFDDIARFNQHKDTLFVGVGQSYTLDSDLDTIINWVNSNYNFPSKSQWSFLGFSLGAYKVFDTVLSYHHDTFNNYCAIGGGTDFNLDYDPEIELVYLCYGEFDQDKASVRYAFNKLRNADFKCNNLKIELLHNTGHSIKEADSGLSRFLNLLEYKKTQENKLNSFPAYTICMWSVPMVLHTTIS